MIEQSGAGDSVEVCRVSQAADSPGGGGMHGSTARHFNGSQYYTYANGEMRNGMVVAAFQLREINEGDGGFGLIPGTQNWTVVPLCPRLAT